MIDSMGKFLTTTLNTCIALVAVATKLIIASVAVAAATNAYQEVAQLVSKPVASCKPQKPASDPSLLYPEAQKRFKS